MSWFILFIKLLHIVGGLLMIAGILGRGIIRVQAGRVKNIHDFELLMQVAGWFENRLVIPSSNLVLLLGLISAWLQGWPVLDFCKGLRLTGCSFQPCSIWA